MARDLSLFREVTSMVVSLDKTPKRRIKNACCAHRTDVRERITYYVFVSVFIRRLSPVENSPDISVGLSTAEYLLADSVNQSYSTPSFTENWV